MATGKPAQIADALLARASTLAVGSPALPILFPEIHADQPASNKYIEVRVIPNRPAWEGITSGVQDQGLLQINVVWPKGQGVIAPLEAAQQVMSHFPKGLALVSGATKVRITAEPYASQPLAEEDQVMVPVTISWAA